MRELSSILQKQDYGHRDAQANGRPSRWLEAAGLLLFTLAGLGERKAFNWGLWFWRCFACYCGPIPGGCKACARQLASIWRICWGC